MSNTPVNQDLFVQKHLPPMDQWPEFINLEKFNYPKQMNCGVELLDKAIDDGFGEKISIYSPSENWTYQQLLEKANQIAHVLTEDLGLIPGNRVLLRSANNPMMAACWFAVVKAGGIAVSTMPLLRAKELTQIVQKAEIKLALCDIRLADEMEKAIELCPSLQRGENQTEIGSTLYFNGKMNDSSTELEERMLHKSIEFDNANTASDDVCLIAFTSGTTGNPKGTLHFHRDLMIICDGYCKEIVQPNQEDIFIGSPPLAFTFGLGGDLLFAIWSRASTILLEKGSPPELLDAMAKFRASVVFTAPTAYRQMIENLEMADLSQLRICVSAGETLPLTTWEKWKAKTGIEILDGLGSTELLHVFISSTTNNTHPGATGKPIPGYEACILDEEGNVAPTGQTGRLAVKGPTGCRYLADDRQKEYVQQGWNVTGDAYKMDEDGYFWFQARTDDMIISSGYNIAAPEVEHALLQHDLVLECAVVGQSDEERSNIVKAFIVLRDPTIENKAKLTKELQDFVKSTIAPYKYPRAIEFINELPKTETGKIQRFKLK